MAIAATSFQEEDGGSRVLAKAIGEDAPGRAGADDDVIVTSRSRHWVVLACDRGHEMIMSGGRKSKVLKRTAADPMNRVHELRPLSVMGIKPRLDQRFAA